MTDEDEMHDTGTIGTKRNDVVRWRYGTGGGDDLFEEGDSFDGLTLIIECSSRADADAMLAALANS